MLKGRIYPGIVGLLIVLVVLALQFSEQPLVREAMQRLDYTLYDLRLRASLEQREPDPRVVIVDIDEHSLRQEGHWPWPRDRLAALTGRLYELGAVVVAYDVVFAEPERNPAEAVLARLDGEEAAVARGLTERLERFDNNLVFAEALQGRDAVLGMLFEPHPAEPKGVLPQALRFDAEETAKHVRLPEPGSYLSNIATLAEANRNGGFFSLQPDADGIFRRAPMLQRFQGAIYPALALEVVRLYYLVDELRLKTALIDGAPVVEAIQLADREIPTDGQGRALVPFLGPQGSFPYLSAADVLSGRFTPEESPLAGSIALVGTSAQGLFDLRATPVEAVYPGVEVHANLIRGILDNDFAVVPSWADGANLSMTVAVGLVLALTLPFLSPVLMVLASAAVTAAAVAANFWLWDAHGLVLELAPVLLVGLAVPLFNIAYGFLQEFRGRRQLKGMFGQYVPPELVEEMNRNPEGEYGFEGESRELSVLFCDIRGFTALSEDLDAARLKALLNRFFTPMTQVIFEHRGTIDKYVGDMIMAFWGAPVEDRSHARHAVAAALQMLERCEALKAEFAAQGLPQIAIGIGINTGPMNVGDMGSEFRRAYTVIGDAVNLASRLEGATKDYGVALVVGEATREQAGGAFVFRELDRIRVKGKARAVTVYEPVCAAEAATPALRAELAEYAEALALFRRREWGQAGAAFEALRAAHPATALYRLYLERIARLRVADPGAAWDGVYERLTK